MNELEELKKRLFKQGLSEEDNILCNLCEVMKICGGYSELMKLPMPALLAVLEYFELKTKEEEKAHKRLRK